MVRLPQASLREKLLAIRVCEWHVLLRAKDAALEEQRSRLAALGGQLSDLEAQRRGLRGQAEERSRRNGALKGAYEALHGRFCQRDGELRRASERGVELLRQLMQQKTAVAERENRRIERARQARLAKELKKATRTVLSIQA
ncbi:Autophagy-related protein 16 [Varanus komodoensis]|nr:Autophagy-related protein 16 [Varanus komodoensis]